jgi:hypothetical protein
MMADARHTGTFSRRAGFWQPSLEVVDIAQSKPRTMVEAHLHSSTMMEGKLIMLATNGCRRLPKTDGVAGGTVVG